MYGPRVFLEKLWWERKLEVCGVQTRQFDIKIIHKMREVPVLDIQVTQCVKFQEVLLICSIPVNMGCDFVAHCSINDVHVVATIIDRLNGKFVCFHLESAHEVPVYCNW